MTTYLILHKVRGEPAFDIAEQVQIGDEEGWIIPTSGHRAYPIMEWDMAMFNHAICMPGEQPLDIARRMPGWDNLADHYQQVDLPAKKGTGLSINLGSILSNLLPKVQRRF